VPVQLCTAVSVRAHALRALQLTSLKKHWNSVMQSSGDGRCGARSAHRRSLPVASGTAEEAEASAGTAFSTLSRFERIELSIDRTVARYAAPAVLLPVWLELEGVGGG